MIKLNRILLILLVILVLIASVGMVVSADSGSGRIVSGDESPTDDVSYGDDSNTGSLDSEDDPGELYLRADIIDTCCIYNTFNIQEK